MMIASSFGNMLQIHFVNEIDISVDILKNVIAAAIAGSLSNLSYVQSWLFAFKYYQTSSIMS